MPPTLKPLKKPDLNREDSVTSLLSTEKIQHTYQLISLYMVSTTKKFQLNLNRYNDRYISYAPKQSGPFECWSEKNQKKINTLFEFSTSFCIR